MTAISDKNSISRNWQIAEQSDGVVTKEEADQILAAVRKGCISGAEQRQANTILEGVHAKLRSLQESARSAGGAALDGHPHAAGLREDIALRTEQVRQNLEMAEYVAKTVDREKHNQNIFQDFWAWLFG